MAVQAAAEAAGLVFGAAISRAAFRAWKEARGPLLS